VKNLMERTFLVYQTELIVYKLYYTLHLGMRQGVISEMLIYVVILNTDLSNN